MAPAEQEKQRTGKAEVGNPARGETVAHREYGRRDHEYRRHLDRVEIYDLVGYGAGEGKRCRVD